ncbi:MAG: HAD hydrolase-like protein [Epsilonproteobacteria bacterium]|nr:HAD hydrolase-like protein [Campylobacterota bacterium]
METKRLLIGLALAGLIASQAHTQDAYLPETISPETFIPKWDLDDTILKKVPYRPLVAKNSAAILYCLMRHPLTFFQLIKTKACSEEWQETFKNFNAQENSYEHRFANMIQKISQEKQLLPGMSEIVLELNKLGYEQHAATNMGEKDYQYLVGKFPELFNCFSHVTYVTYDKNKKKIKKPMPEYFTNVVATHNNPTNKKCCLIDDKAENCKAAQEAVGWYSIQVPGNENNAKFLTRVLQERGVQL